MSDLEHLYLLRTRHKQRLRGLEEKHAHYGASADPSIPNEIKDIRGTVADLERKIVQQWLSLLKRYQLTLSTFLGLLEQRNPHREQALDYQKHLHDLIALVSENGDFEATTAECERFAQNINALAAETLGTTFDDLITSSALARQGAKADTGRREPASSPTTYITGSVGTMHSGSGDIYITNTSEPVANPLDLQLALLRRAIGERAANRELLAKGQRKLDDLRDAILQADLDELAAAVAWLQKHISLGLELSAFFGHPAIYAMLRRAFPGDAEVLLRRVGASEC